MAASLVAKRKFDAINADAAADRPYDDGNGNWKSYEKTATVLYLVGGGVLVGGVVLYATARDARPETKGMRSASLRPQLAPGRAGAALSVRFS